MPHVATNARPSRSETPIPSSSADRVLDDTFANVLEDVARCGDTERSYKLPIRLIKHAALRNAEACSPKRACVRSCYVASSASDIFSAIMIVGMFVFAVGRRGMTEASAT